MFAGRKPIESITTLTKYYGSLLNWDLARIYLTVPRTATNSNIDHVQAAVQWLFRAQEAFITGGVARSYAISYKPFFSRRGWIGCYPETTGYIIPTIFDYARLTGSEEAFKRAVRMADWECDVQMANGAVQGGTVDQVPAPAIFNTGQVIFGWVRAFVETKEERYLTAAAKAGGFLASQQDEDGAWRRNLSLYATDRLNTYTYNTRTAWALMCLFEVTKDDLYQRAAIKNIEFALTQQLANGWFDNNCLSDATQPLLHTIAYCIRGILEVGNMLGKESYINAAGKAAEALIGKQGKDGGLMGCYNDNWDPTVTYSCLTGDAQIGVIWGRLYQITRENKYLDSMRKMTTYLKRRQIWDPKNPYLHGGLTGSFPIHGRYGKYEILSWAVKFFIDALILETSILATRVEA